MGCLVGLDDFEVCRGVRRRDLIGSGGQLGGATRTLVPLPLTNGVAEIRLPARAGGAAHQSQLSGPTMHATGRRGDAIFE